MIGEIASTIGSIVNMLSSNKEAGKQNQMLEEIMRQNKVSESVLGGESIMAENANQGLQGYQGMVDEVKSELPASMNQFKDAASAGTLVDVLGNFQARQNKQLRSLSQQNEQQKLANKEKYANYLGTTVGGAQRDVNTTNMQLGLAGIGMQRQGKKDQMSYLSEGLGNLGKLGDKDNSDWISGLFGGGNSKADKGLSFLTNSGIADSNVQATVDSGMDFE